MNEYLKDETEMSFESFDHGKYDIPNYGLKYNIIWIHNYFKTFSDDQLFFHIF